MTNQKIRLQDIAQNINIELYLERWIAIVRGRVIGVGHTRQQAYRAAMQIRLKDKPLLVFIDAEGQVQSFEEE